TVVRGLQNRGIFYQFSGPPDPPLGPVWRPTTTRTEATRSSPRRRFAASVISLARKRTWAAQAADAARTSSAPWSSRDTGADSSGSRPPTTDAHERPSTPTARPARRMRSPSRPSRTDESSSASEERGGRPRAEPSRGDMALLHAPHGRARRDLRV